MRRFAVGAVVVAIVCFFLWWARGDTYKLHADVKLINEDNKTLRINLIGEKFHLTLYRNGLFTMRSPFVDRYHPVLWRPEKLPFYCDVSGDTMDDGRLVGGWKRTGTSITLSREIQPIDDLPSHYETVTRQLEVVDDGRRFVDSDVLPGVRLEWVRE